MDVARSSSDAVRLIVNADDLGRTERINEGVEAAYRRGILSSTSIVANSPALDHALRVVRTNPGLGVGVHLVLHEYLPLTSSDYLRRLSRKSFLGAAASLASATRARLRAVEAEWRTQIERLLAHGIRLTHLDGHNHVHVHPRLTDILARLARDYAIRYLRLPRERLAHGKPNGRYLQKAILSGVCTWAALLLRARVSWPTGFHGFSEGGALTAHAIRRLLRRMDPGVNELMCHVGTENDDPPFHIGYRWLDELRAVTSFTKEQLLREYGIQVISYREIS